MSKELNELLSHLQECDLKNAAFDIIKSFEGGVYSNQIQEAFNLFTTLPCPETGIILIAAYPKLAQVIALSSSSIVENIPKDLRGSKYDEYDEWMACFDYNLEACDCIHKYLLNGSTNGTISIGFHNVRDQKVVFERLSLLGFRKGFFKNKRQFLRDEITKNISVFRCVIDLICIHGVDEGKERFWNALGNELNPQFYLQSEILYNLSTNVKPFPQMISGLTNFSK